MDKLNRQIEVLNRLSEEFSTELENSTNQLQNNSDAISKKQEELKNSFDERIDYHAQKSDDLDKSISEHKEDIRDVTGNIKNDTTDIGNNISELRDRPSYSDIINKKNSKLQNTISAIKNISEITTRMKNSLEEKREKVDDVERDFSYLSGDIEDLYKQSNELLDYLESEKKDFKDDLSDTRGIIDDKANELKSEINKAKEDLRVSKQNIQSSIDNIKNEVENIKVTINDGEQAFKNKIEDKNFYYDISGDSDKNYNKSKVINSFNKAEIIGDFNVAGIAGRIGIDLKETIADNVDLSDKIEKHGETSLNFTRNVYSVIENNINESDIHAKNDYVGGIVGKADYGALSQNQNYGNITSKDGMYAGGIAGYSKNIVKNSYSLGDVSAKDYVGGIAGMAKELNNNTVMSNVASSEDAKKGSIAGDIIENGIVEKNRYVDYNIGAVNNVTFENQTSTVSYRELLDNVNTPERFKHLKVNYVIGDNIIKSIEVNYDSIIDVSEIPAIPEKNGYNTYWEEQTGGVRKNITLHLIEELWNKNISSKEVIDNKPILLANAYFYNNTSLKINEVKLETQALFGKKAIKSYSYSISPNSHNLEIELRVLNDNNADTIAVKNEQGYEIVKSEKIGSYLSFNVTSSSGEFIILKSQETNVNQYIIFSVIGIIAIIVFITFKKSHSKKATN